MSDNESTRDCGDLETREESSDEIYEVEKILAHKVQNDELSLLVRWLGYGQEYDTWEPELELKESAGEVVSEYYKKMKVNDKTELIERLQKQIKRNKANAKKRERSPIEDDDANESDESNSNRKAKKSKKSKRDTPASSNTPKVPTKAALKSYETPKSEKVTPNNAKKTAMEIRDNRWGSGSEEDSHGETDAPSDIDLMRKKVKSKSNRMIPNKSYSSSPEPVEPKSRSIEKEKSATPQPRCSSPKLLGKRNDNHVSSSHGRSRALDVPIVNKEPEPTWTVTGIVLHSVDANNKKKLILMTNSETGEKKVLNGKEAFELGGWALTKYLLDRCEF